ncbi:MAG: LapA family protein [Rhodospirillales bacterium]|nr:LapA family protein [Rhodospirillales bacterium]
MGKLLYWIAVIPLFLVVIVFSVTNHATTELSLWPALTEPVPFPVYGIALVALFIGFVWGGIVSWFQSGSSRRRARELQRQHEADQREIVLLRDRLNRLQESERQATIPLPPSEMRAAPPPAGSAPAAIVPTVVDR